MRAGKRGATVGESIGQGMQGAGQEVMNIAMLHMCIEEGIGVGCASQSSKELRNREFALGMAGQRSNEKDA